MAGLNKVQLIGRLGRDPETRRTGSGAAVVSFSMATSESWKDKNTGERKDRTEWHNIVIFNEGLGRVADQYLRKGSQCYVSGKMATRKYTDRDGNERYTTEIVLQQLNGELVLLDSKDSGTRADENAYGRESSRDRVADQRPAGGGKMGDVIDDDIPF